MVRIIDICSGKGGVGKTTVAANLGAAIQSFGRKVVVVDFNLTTPHLSLLFGIYNLPLTLNNFLRNEAGLEEIIYTLPSGLRIVPASIELKEIIDVNVNSLREKFEETFNNFDVVLLDSAPGLGREALIALQLANEVLFVANPYIPSVVDVVKCKQLVGSLERKPLVMGIILNRVKKKRYELSQKEVEEFTELPVLCNIPEDEKILENLNRRVFSVNSLKAKEAFLETAAKIVGAEYRRPSMLSRIVQNILRRR